MAFLDTRQTADAGANEGSDPVGVRLGNFQPRVPDRLHRRADAVMDKGIHLLGVLGIQVLFDLKILHRAADTYRKTAHVEGGDRPDPAAARQDIGPGGLHGVANRGYDAHACHYHSPLGHGTPLNVPG